MPISVGPQPLAGPSIKAYTTHPRPIASADAPATSMEWSAVGSRDSGTWRSVNTNAIATSGRLMKNTARHDTDSINQPPRNGPDRAGDAAEAGPRTDRGAAVARGGTRPR